jgi:RNA polymerase sigma factor (sigma-70 family)
MTPGQEAREFEKWESLVFRVAKDRYGVKKLHRDCWNQGHLHPTIMPEDLVQEGSLALLYAIRNFRPEENPGIYFGMYAYIAIMLNMSRFTQRHMHRQRVEAGGGVAGAGDVVAISSSDDDSLDMFVDYYDKQQETGDEIVGNADFTEHCLKKLRSRMDPSDVDVLIARAGGATYEQLSKQLGLSVPTTSKKVRNLMMVAAQILEPERGEL